MKDINREIITKIVIVAVVVTAAAICENKMHSAVYLVLRIISKIYSAFAAKLTLSSNLIWKISIRTRLGKQKMTAQQD